MKGYSKGKFRACLVALVCPWVFIVGYQSAEAQQNLAQEAYAIFQQNCLNCHGEHGAYTEEIILEHTALIETGAVVPGNPIGSELYRRLLENNPAKRMPLGQPQLSAGAILTIRNWIQAGAPDWRSTSEADGAFITPKEMLETIERHVNSLSPFDRAFTRYFTLTHLYNAGESAEALHAYQRALSKLVNSLSWGREVIKPQPIDPEETIFYIDLRDYEWEIGTNRWTQIEQVYPYSIEFTAPTQTSLREKLTNLREEMNCEAPFVDVDWFIATASLPPLYHDILGLPQTDRELEARLEVNVVENIRNAAGRRVWRAGFNDSGVSNNNRVLERHTSRYGAYWKSYDFAGSVGTQNILTHPLSFTHDGGEIIFNLPNGLQAYFLVDAGGNRLDAAPIKIVRNPAASDPTVRNGLSCIGCHTEGMKAFEDQVRGVVEQNPNPPYDKARALRLYAEKAKMDEYLEKDTAHYRQALEATGDVFGGIEPVQRFYEAFQRPLDVVHAAAAVGLETADFLQKIRENASLKNLGLAVLTGVSGSVKRDTWTSNFSEIVTVLRSPDSSVVKPVVPQTERIPGASVHIPDANLRAAIAEALGKAPGAAITVAEMATLTSFTANDRDIRNLTGLEFAKNLEVLELNNNLIADLSPLTELINLRNLRLYWNKISDLSPLASLIKLRGLGISHNLVSDLSPLAELTELQSLICWESSVSDLSPLAGLPKLNWVDLCGAKISDLSPLAGVTSLRSLKLFQNSISDLSPLAGLSGLERLEIHNNKVSDVSSLAELSNLKWVGLSSNKVSDVSALAGLSNLEWLRLGNNAISDFSPLEGLPKSVTIIQYGNPGFPLGGPKIEGPWLWVLVPGEHLGSTDLLAEASEGIVMEQDIADHGATEGKSVGDSVWTPHKISPTGENNITEMTDTLGWGTDKNIYDHVVYGSVVLGSPREQNTKVFVGSGYNYKIWLNGELVSERLDGFTVYNYNYQVFFPVTLREGANVLLIAIDNHSHDRFNGFFGFESGTEYTVIPPGVGFAFSSTTTNVLVGDTFTIHLKAEKVPDLAGWQFDIEFDPAVLKVVEVTEGEFLKMGGSTTFFQKGAIDNAAGKITGLSAARISENGVSGTGTLLSVTFSAKVGGETQVVLRDFEFGSISGEIIRTIPPKIIISIGDQPAWDVNQDGRVSILDMILVAQQLGKTASANSEVDVNDDGIISILDLILVAQHMGESTSSASPSMLAMDSIDGLDPAMIQAWIERAQVEDDGSIAFQQGIAYLQSLLASLIPEETALLPNYPNPFNPETWIPYQLSKPAEVTLRIYAVNGVLVRTLALGQTPAGIYQSRSRAAYWDGRNNVGESVASGIYFYTLTAGDFTATRKLLIRK